MRFHIIGLPHTQATSAYSACAFTDKLRKFAKMMTPRGHQVFLYHGEETDAPVEELIPCFAEAERAAFVGDRHYTDISWDNDRPEWQRFNGRVAAEIRKRAQPHDFVCVTVGTAQKPVADALPDLRVVEYGIGYAGTFAQFRVFESYAWMHTIYGADTRGRASDSNGHWFDGVIPGAVDMDLFPFPTQKDGYFLYIGRLIDRKGYQIAADVCQTLGRRLVIAGPGTPPSYGGYVGVVGPKVRARLMGGATAVFVPTIYVEPFGNVVIEAMASGTPVITTDWGAFTETVQEGVTGFRCRTFGQFLKAAETAHTLDPAKIREYARSRYSLEVTAKQYEDYFERLSLLWGEGWSSRTA